MTKHWYEYEYGPLFFTRGDTDIGGEHGIDLRTPLFTPITALLPGTITGIQGAPIHYGLTITWRLLTPYKGVPYMYTIHLAALAPGIDIGHPLTAGDVIGYSGGATQASLADDLAQTPYTLPAELSNYLDNSDSSGGAHVEVGFTYNQSYGTGAGFVPGSGFLQQHPELNPKEFLDQIRERGIGMVLDIQAASNYFSDLGNDVWQSKKNGFVVGHGILSFYRHFGGDALNGLTYLGLPLFNEIPIPQHSGVVFQQFERGKVCWDPAHEVDSPPGAGQAYLMHVPQG